MTIVNIIGGGLLAAIGLAGIILCGLAVIVESHARSKGVRHDSIGWGWPIASAVVLACGLSLLFS